MACQEEITHGLLYKFSRIMAKLFEDYIYSSDLRFLWKSKMVLLTAVIMTTTLNRTTVEIVTNKVQLASKKLLINIKL